MVGMIRVLAMILAVASPCDAPVEASTSKSAEGLPFNEAADVQAEIRAAMTQAAAEKKYVLLIFGANWCIDCRELSANDGQAAAFRSHPAALRGGQIDIGNWNRNLDVVKAWGNPTRRAFRGSSSPTRTARPSI